MVSLSLDDGILRIFVIPGSNHQEITEAGEKTLLRISKVQSNKNPEGCLGPGIYNTGCKFKCFRSGRIASASFGCRQMSLLQVLFANNEVARHAQSLQPKEWGRCLSSSRNVYLSIITETWPVLENMLKTVRCQTTSGSEYLRWGCRRNGLPFSFSCVDWKGVLCANAAARQNEDDNEDEQEEELALACAFQSKSFCD